MRRCPRPGENQQEWDYGLMPTPAMQRDSRWYRRVPGCTKYRMCGTQCEEPSIGRAGAERLSGWSLRTIDDTAYRIRRPAYLVRPGIFCFCRASLVRRAASLDCPLAA